MFYIQPMDRSAHLLASLHQHASLQLSAEVCGSDDVKCQESRPQKKYVSDAHHGSCMLIMDNE